MKITFFIYYPHPYKGTYKGTAEMDANQFAFLHLLYTESVSDTVDADIAEEAYDLMLEDIEEATGIRFPDLMSEAFEDFGDDLMEELSTKGFKADMWEEGSYFFATQHAIGKAKAAIRKIELANIDLDI